VLVGHVAQVLRYPVKSLQGEELRETQVGIRGLRGDRAWAVYTPDGGIGSGKTTRRFRRVDGLLEHRSRLDSGPVPLVTLSSGATHRADDPRAGTALGTAPDGGHLELRPESDVAHHDESPVHLVTTATLRALARLLGGPVDARRLRPNLVLGVPGEGFTEEDWTGRELHVGDVVLALGPGMPRCRMVDLPQPEVDTGAALLAPLGRAHGPTAGLQAGVRSGGVLRVGDAAYLR
jgi:uncharacterized protein YcbX